MRLFGRIVVSILAVVAVIVLIVLADKKFGILSNTDNQTEVVDNEKEIEADNKNVENNAPDNNDSAEGDADTEEDEIGSINVVCTTWPIYNIVKDIVSGCDFNVEYIEKGNVDLHSFNPTVDDIAKIQDSDVLVYIGGDSDEWIEDVEHYGDEINIMELLAERCSEALEFEDEDEYDEHVWLSPRVAIQMAEGIAEELERAWVLEDDELTDNVATLVEKLSAIDAEYEQLVGTKIVVADRNPMLTLAKNYGMTVEAAFSGCSAESEASFETIDRLATTCSRYNIQKLVILDGSDGKIAEQLKNITGIEKVVTFNSMQSNMEGCDYFDILENNLKVLVE